MAALVLRLEGLLAERQDLIERLEHALQGEGADDYRSRLARLAHEQERVLAELDELLPPDRGESAPRG